jgi:hypothetical protein
MAMASSSHKKAEMNNFEKVTGDEINWKIELGKVLMTAKS